MDSVYVSLAVDQFVGYAAPCHAVYIVQPQYFLLVIVIQIMDQLFDLAFAYCFLQLYCFEFFLAL